MRKLIFVLLLLYAAHASALGQFSRACNLATVPLAPIDLYTPAITLLYSAGAAMDHSILLTPQQATFAWVNESITVDWLTVKYWLWAGTATYKEMSGTSTMVGPPRPGPWTIEVWGQWVSTDPRFAAIFNNAVLGYSSRAGAPGLVEMEGVEIPYVHDIYTGSSLGGFRVQGVHYYFNPNALVTGPLVQLPNTMARDCNLTQWGFEWHL